MDSVNKSSSSMNGGQTYHKLTFHQTKEASNSWDNFKRQNGCVKVTDPYYGKRKQSNTVRRIQRKIQLMEGRMTHDEQEMERSSSHVGNDKQDNNLLRLGSLSSSNNNWKQKATNSEGIKRVNPPQTAPIIKISEASDERPELQIEDQDTWLTKDELLEIFFRSL